jgi:hypothetical protein
MPQAAEVTQTIPALGRPFVISKALLNGSYYLVDIRELDKRPGKKRKRRDPDDVYDKTDHPWNIAQLRPFYT